MILKKLLKMLLLVGVCTIPCTGSFASGMPEVLWDIQAVNGVERRDDSIIPLVDQQALNSVGKLLDKRLKELELQGKLPFKPIVISDYKNNTWKSKLESSEALALVPVITSEANTRRYVVYKGITYYAYDIMAELNVMLCSFDGKNLKIVYNVPLSNKAVLGDSFEDALQEPLTEAELKEQFRYNLEQLIEELEFDNSIKEIISAPEDFPTYQVTEVRVAPEIVANYSRNELSETRVEKIAKPVVASTFTNIYASKYRNRVVLPSKQSGLTWRKEIVKHISSNDISAGEYSAENEAVGDVELVLTLENFDVKKYSRNEYSILSELDYTTYLNASEKSTKGEKQISWAFNKKNYRLPKVIEAEVEINYIDLFSEAASKLGDALVPERKKTK